MHSNRVVRPEPAGVYKCHHGGGCAVTPGGALQDETGHNVVFDVVFSSGAVSPATLARRKTHGHHTVADREEAVRARGAVHRDTYAQQKRGGGACLTKDPFVIAFEVVSSLLVCVSYMRVL